MKEEGQDTWSGKTIAEKDLTGSSMSLTEMLADARAKSRGQGVVQGSTMFFKNLAESIGHSNRNLKIGLGFLGATLVIIAVVFGVLVYKVFLGQEETKTGIASKLGEMDERTRAQMQPLIDAVKSLESRVEDGQKSLEAQRLTSAKEIDDLRRENEALRVRIEQLNASLADTQKILSQLGTVYDQDRKMFNERLQAMSR